jgi:hypothetical protein
MFRNLCRIVTTWPFLLGLGTLLANDDWFKRAHPGMLSGKLSDFAGIALVSLLLLAALPGRRRLAAAIVVAGFAWWKSPLSEPAIAALNACLSSPVGRTVDYTDLVALLVIPACADVASRPGDFALPGRTLRRLLLAPLIALTALALMATSVMPTRQEYQVRRVDRAPDLDREAVAQTIAQVAELHGLQCDNCANGAGSGRLVGDGIVLSYEFIGARSIAFKVEAFPNGFFFGASGKEKADRLRSALKSRLASDFKDLEYVEQLDPKPSALRPGKP